MGMRGNVSSTSLSGKRKTLHINNLDRYPGSRQTTLYYLTARLGTSTVVGGDNKYSKGAPIRRRKTLWHWYSHLLEVRGDDAPVRLRRPSASDSPRAVHAQRGGAGRAAPGRPSPDRRLLAVHPGDQQALGSGRPAGRAARRLRGRAAEPGGGPGAPGTPGRPGGTSPRGPATRAFPATPGTQALAADTDGRRRSPAAAPPAGRPPAAPRAGAGRRP